MTAETENSPSEEQDQSQRVLGGRVSREGEHALNLQRELTAAEVEDLRAKGRLIRRLADQAGYAQLVNSTLRWESVVQQLTTELRENRVAPRTREAASREFLVMTRQAERFAAELEEQISTDYPAASPERQRFDQALSALRESDAWRRIERLKSGIDNLRFALANNRLEIADSREPAESAAALDLTYALAGRCQLLIGAFLGVYEERFKEVAISIRRISAEVLEGVPSIITTPRDPETGRALGDQMTFEDLPAAEIAAVVEALRRSKDLERLAAEAEANEAEASSSASDEPPPELARPLDPHEPTSAEDPSGEVVDLDALVRQVIEIAPELERAWSSALDAVDIDAVRQGTDTAWRTLLLVVQRQVTASDRRLQAAGIDTRIPGFSLGAADLAALDSLPQAERHWRLMQAAQLWASMRLAQAMGAVTEKAHRRISLAAGEVETWWESGAFSLVRTRALVLARIFRLAQQAEAALLNEDVPADPLREADEALRAAKMADARGDAEAAVVHSLRGFRARAERALDESEALPEEFLTRLASIPGWDRHAYVLDLVAKVGHKELADRCDLGELVALDQLLIPLLGALYQEVSDQAIRMALGFGNDEA